MASNKAVEDHSESKEQGMRSVERARYEAGLAQLARGARAAAAALDESGCGEASWEFAMIAAWAKSELERSIRGKPPLKGQMTLFPSGAPTQA